MQQIRKIKQRLIRFAHRIKQIAISVWRETAEQRGRFKFVLALCSTVLVPVAVLGVFAGLIGVFAASAIAVGVPSVLFVLSYVVPDVPT